MGEWKEAKTGDARVYYYHTDTKEVTWTKPAEFDGKPAPPATPQGDQATIDAGWKEARTPDGRVYYYNDVTKVTSWQAPPAYLQQRQNQNSRPAPAFVAGGGQNAGGRDSYAQLDRRVDRRDDRDHGLPQKPSFDGGRGGGVPWEQRQENTGFRGPMPVKTDEPEYGTYEQAEDAFFKMLRKHNISPDTSWEEALRQVIREKDYRALKDPKERKQAFEKYCLEVRAQEKGKEKERQERLRDDFRKMLATHEDIKHYTRWKTARPIIEREAVFKSTGNGDERRQMFDEYILGLKKKHAEQEVERRRNALQDLETLLQALIVDSDTTWSDAQERIRDNERFASDDKFRALSNVDVLAAFDTHIKALDRVANDAKQKEKRMRVRKERKARDGFKELLEQMRAKGMIKASTKWKDFQPLVATDERYVNMIGTPGSTLLDLFWDVVEDEEHKLRSYRNYALDVLEERKYEMTMQTTLDDFAGVMRSGEKTARFNEEEMSLVYERLMEKIRRRADESRVDSERQRKKGIDALRSVLKHLDPPVRVSDTYDDIVARLQGHDEFEQLRDEDARRGAFEKHIRRLKEKEEDAERDRSRRDRDRDYRNGSRRDHERDRDRRHRTRTPEVDAYEADRRKAQADRERHYRKASFGLTPPPRERRDERDDRHYRYDRRESMSVYDRERREREMERERNYVSRADPRDKGRTLDYGDDEAVGSRPSSVRKRRDSDGSVAAGSRDAKRLRLDRPRRTSESYHKEDSPALQSGSEEGEIEEV